MADETQDLPPPDASLDDVLAQYIAAEESGQPGDRRAILAAHPHLADELREFFANRDQMQRLAQPLRGADPAVELHGLQPLPRLRYFGDYELLEDVAVGGMGIVYRARQVSLNRIVAVKMILKGTLATEEDVRRFRAEAEAAANLQHPGIVAIHEVGLHEGQHYFSMDFVEGQNLADLVREQPLPLRQAVEYLREAAEAVHFAHQQGTLHRDLKPSNILIDRHDRVRITDFGLAKRIEGQSDLTLTGQVLGTPAYMPPEQASGKRSLIGAASDVYALGAVLYELLAGRPPFRGETPVETLRQVESLDAVSPRLLNPAVPRDLETMCLKCLEKEPHKRYGTAQLLADDLGRFLRHEPILARPISRTARAWRWCRRSPVIAGLSAAVLSLLLLSTVASSLGYLSVRKAWQSEVGRRVVENDLRIREALELLQGPRPDFLRAEALLAEAIARRPDDSALFLHRGRARYEQGEIHGAIEDARHSLKLQPRRNSEARLLLIEAALDARDRAVVQMVREELDNEQDGPDVWAARALSQPLADDSLRLASDALEHEPQEPRHLARRGWIARQRLLYRTAKRDYDLAIADLEQVLHVRPFDRRARLQLCATYIQFHFLADEVDQPLARARDLLDAWRASAPDDVDMLVLFAQWHLQQHQPEAALEVCQRGRKLAVLDPAFALCEGLAQMRLGRWQEADSALLAAAQLSAERPSTTLGVSSVLIAGLRAKIAASALQRALPGGQAAEELRGFPDPESLLAEIAVPSSAEEWTYGEWASFVAAWRKIGGDMRLEGSSRSSPALLKAKQLCEQWSALAPECPGPWQALGLLESGPNARNAFTQALRLAPSYRWPRYHRAKLHAAARDYREAIADLEAFLRYFPDSAPAQSELAHLLLECPDAELRDPGRAATIASRLVEQHPKRDDFWHLVARAEMQLSRYSQALSALEAAQKLKSRHEPYMLMRGDVLLKLSRIEDARQAYERALFGRSPERLNLVAWQLAIPLHGSRECYDHARMLAEEATETAEREIAAGKRRRSRLPHAGVLGVALYRLGRFEEALAHLGNEPNADPILLYFRVMALWAADRRDEAWRLYQEQSLKLGASLVMLDPLRQTLAVVRQEAAGVIGAQLGSDAIRQDLLRRDVGPGDWPQWGGWSGRNNVALAERSPTDWNIGKFDRKTGAWDRAKAKNIKWVTPLGSQTYGNPVVANGKIFVGTNNSHGYLERFPPDVDLGVLLCLSEADGSFLWQLSVPKLPTGRVHDWPLQGICSAPLVEGDRVWVVTNRGEVLCLDSEGFLDGEDDGPDQGFLEPLFRVPAYLSRELDSIHSLPEPIRQALRDAGYADGPQASVRVGEKGKSWTVHRNVRVGDRAVWRHDAALELDGERIRIQPLTEDGAPQGGTILVEDAIWKEVGTPEIIRALAPPFERSGVSLPDDLNIRVVEEGQAWAFDINEPDDVAEVHVRLADGYLSAERRLLKWPTQKQEADVVWRLDMMKELGVSQHNMCTCAPTAWGDVLFINTSNGVDESHKHIPAPDAPSFIALDKHSGQVLWTDNSPGANIHHGQWSAPAVGVFAGVPQVIFGAGDGWVYSFHAEQWEDSKPILLWKFDTNPKDAVLELGGRGTRNEPIAVPVIYDGLVYVSIGQDPEHGEGLGRLWCIDPTRRGDVSPQLAVHMNDRNTVLPHRRVRAIEPEQGEVAIDNPNSAAVWEYSRRDENGDLRFDFEEEFHRTVSSIVAKHDLLIAVDFSGLVHCLNAKTGRRYWTCDLLAAVWGTPLVVGDRVFVPDEDGDIAIFRLHPDPVHSTRTNPGRNNPSREPLLEINMGSSVYSTPLFANGVLYIANKDRLFAIAEVESVNQDEGLQKSVLSAR